MDSVSIKKDFYGKSQGFGWVVFETPEDAKMAKDYYNLLSANDPTLLYVNEHAQNSKKKV